MADENRTYRASVALGGKVTLELNDSAEQLLILAGWTPPGIPLTTEAERFATQAYRDMQKRKLARELRQSAEAVRRQVVKEIAYHLEHRTEWTHENGEPSPWVLAVMRHANPAGPNVCPFCRHHMGTHAATLDGHRCKADHCSCEGGPDRGQS